MQLAPTLLTGFVMWIAALHSTVADPISSRQSPEVKGSHAAVMDLPAVVDMSFADPKTWGNLPPAVEVQYDARLLGRLSVGEKNCAAHDYSVTGR
jgi:hypothetical protein